MACNIVSPKKVDGIQKLLTKIDILQIAKHKEIDIMEKALKDKHQELVKMIDDTNVNMGASHACNLFGRFAVRLMWP